MSNIPIIELKKIGMLTRTIVKPISTFKGIPTTKTFICGIVFDIIPNTKSVKKIIATIGADSLNPISKVFDKEFTKISIVNPVYLKLPIGKKL